LVCFDFSPHRGNKPLSLIPQVLRHFDFLVMVNRSPSCGTWVM
jgi:uncharacterized protein YbbK (DUF523 family)